MQSLQVSMSQLPMNNDLLSDMKHEDAMFAKNTKEFLQQT